jgi:SSS family solute:Na+ symporter
MFQYIQEYTGLVSPGILGVFIMGLFWKKANSKGAISGVLASIPFALLLKLLPIQMPFLDQMLYTCLFTMVVIAMVSLLTAKVDDAPGAISLPSDTFKTSPTFNVAAYLVMIILVVLYVVFW